MIHTLFHYPATKTQETCVPPAHVEIELKAILSSLFLVHRTQALDLVQMMGSFDKNQWVKIINA